VETLQVRECASEKFGLVMKKAGKIELELELTLHF
jgi:hypothetical protein